MKSVHENRNRINTLSEAHEQLDRLGVPREELDGLPLSHVERLLWLVDRESGGLVEPRGYKGKDS